jgi:hypothetical protein
MKTPALFCFLLLAKVACLAGRHLDWSGWLPIAMLWQDVVLVLCFAIWEFCFRKRPFVVRASYVLIILYTAINVPLVRLLSSPMTMQMSRAAGGALADSIRHHLTPQNVILIGFLVAAGCVLPLCMRRLSPRLLQGGALLTLLVAAMGPSAIKHVDTAGLHRNAVLTLVLSARERVHPARADENWRASSFGRDRAEILLLRHGSSSGRNVVLVSLESTGASYLGAFGARVDPMPLLTRFLTNAVLFENTYAVYPESIKGLFSVLCSRYPAMDTRAETYASAGKPSLAEVFQTHRYHTALFHSGRFMYLGMEAVVENRGFQVLEDAGQIGGAVESSFGVDDSATVTRMLGWIDSLPGKEPFFLTYLPISGHHPYEAPGPFDHGREDQQYLNALHYSDQELSRFIAGLNDRGLLANTVFVIYGDHGEAFGQHEGNYGHTLFIYEENVHVPLIIAAPGLIGSVRDSRPVSLIDIAPTILDLLGCEIPSEYQGQSLLQPARGMALFFTDYSLPLLGLRDGDWKCIYDLESKRLKLFNLVSDPQERADLSPQTPERARFYQTRLETWSAAQKALFNSYLVMAGRGRGL